MAINQFCTWLIKDLPLSKAYFKFKPCSKYTVKKWSGHIYKILLGNSEMVVRISLTTDKGVNLVMSWKLRGVFVIMKTPEECLQILENKGVSLLILQYIFKSMDRHIHQIRVLSYQFGCTFQKVLPSYLRLSSAHSIQWIKILRGGPNITVTFSFRQNKYHCC